jgi:DamX protein
MVAHIYRETHGVPGRIIAGVSGLSGAKPSGKLKWILAIAIAIAIATAIAIAIGVQLLTLPNNNKEAITPDEQKKVNNIEVMPQKQESQIPLPLPPAQPPVQPVIPQQQSLPSSEGNGALPPLVNGQPSVNSTVKPEIVSAMDIAQKLDNNQPAVVQQKIAEPQEATPEKPKQTEIPKTVNNIEPLNPEKPENKTLSVPVSPVAAEPKPDNVQPIPVQQKIAQPLAPTQAKPKQAETSKTVNNAQPAMPNTLETIQLPQKPVEVAAAPDQPAVATPAPQQAGPEESWASPTGNFTLQLMVLSKQSSAADMVKKYPAMEPDIRVVNTFANGKEKFILEYGSYPDAASANRAKQSLPFEFHKALVRKIDSKNQR